MHQQINEFAATPGLRIARGAVVAAAAGQVVLIVAMYVLMNVGVLEHDEFGFPGGIPSLMIHVIAWAWGAACLSWFPGRAAEHVVRWLGVRHVVAIVASLVMLALIEGVCWCASLALR